ncbi:MAG TPA: amidase [bacterium]|nr:amidase [bacterium]
MSSDLAFRSVVELSRLIGDRQISPVDVVAALLDAIDRWNSTLRSYITVCAESALADARRAERDIAAGDYRGPLHGIPVSHKDISWTAGIRTTAHSKILLDYVPDADATHVARLQRAGMILLGKTNTTEFATGGMEIFGTTRNPWDLTSFTGASSGGSANALAAGLAVAATGSDTGGSIRIPSSFCGVVGVKPTFGRVSRHGLIALSYTMDHVGPMARTVADCALLLRQMAGYDPLDPSSSQVPIPDFAAGFDRGLAGTVLGVPEHHFYENLDPEVDVALRSALQRFEHLGARLEPVAVPHAGDMMPVGLILSYVESFSQHAEWLRARAAEYGTRSRRRFCAGAFYTAAEYQQAMQLRTLWIQELDDVFQRVDALVTPTVPFPAFAIAVQESGPPNTTWNTRHFNVSGHPALSLPCGFSAAGLPIGMQLTGKWFDEPTLFRIAHAYEQSTRWHKQRPSLQEEPYEPSESRLAAG